MTASSRTLKLVILDECRDDIRDLPSRNLQRLVLQRIVDLKAGRLQGRPLRDQGGRDLSGCRKLYVGANPALRKPSHRIVYRLLPDEAHPSTLEVIAVGPRADLAAYRDAALRLEHDR